MVWDGIWFDFVCLNISIMVGRIYLIAFIVQILIIQDRLAPHSTIWFVTSLLHLYKWMLVFVVFLNNLPCSTATCVKYRRVSVIFVGRESNNTAVLMYNAKLFNAPLFHALIYHTWDQISRFDRINRLIYY